MDSYFFANYAMIWNMQENRKKRNLLSILPIQAAVIIYTMSGLCAKAAARYPRFSKMNLLFLFLELMVLGIYAVVWQQIIKRFDLSLAYANRASAIFWSMIWAAVLFRETITWKNILGIVVIFCGILLVNSDAA